jgi:hypothetical protein
MGDARGRCGVRLEIYFNDFRDRHSYNNAEYTSKEKWKTHSNKMSLGPPAGDAANIGLTAEQQENFEEACTRVS